MSMHVPTGGSNMGRSLRSSAAACISLSVFMMNMCIDLYTQVRPPVRPPVDQGFEHLIKVRTQMFVKPLFRGADTWAGDRETDG